VRFRHSLQIVVVIPTRARRALLIDLLRNIDLANKNNISTCVIVDSSANFQYIVERFSFKLIHLPFEVQSAAQQRNRGLEELETIGISDDSIVCFLDDDVRIQENYFEKILSRFNCDANLVGLSGITEEYHLKKNWLRRLFFASGDSGTVTKGIINIPAADVSTKGPTVSEWLIGCANWRWHVIRNLRFEIDFLESSIFEDVIFSYRAGQSGTLKVDPSILLSHLHSEVGRASTEKNYKDWVMNRYRLMELFPDKFYLINFQWTNFGILISKLLSLLYRRDKRNFDAASGILAGMRKTWKKPSL